MATKKKSKGTRAKASAQRDWNGAERFQAISPVMGKIMQVRELAAARTYAPAMEAALAQSDEMEIREAVRAAAKESGATEDQISTWVDVYSSLGKPGLMQPIPLTAADCAANLHGTFELMSRYSGGNDTAARSRIYGDMEPDKARGKQLITMWTEECHFKRSGSQTFFLIALCDLQFKQNGPYEVIGNSTGSIYGNFGDYQKGVKTTDTFRLMRMGQNESMVGNPSRTQSGGSDSAARFLVEVGGDAGTIKYKMWGVPATADNPRTLDTVDTYQVMSYRRPLVGGWETITDYFNRLTQKGKGKGAGIQAAEAPGTRQALQRACEEVRIPHRSRLG